MKKNYFCKSKMNANNSYMKKFLSMIAIVMGMIPAIAQTNNGAQQQKFTVSGTCPADKKMVYLVDVAKRYARIDSVQVKDGKFAISGNFDKDAFLGVGFGPSYCLFINDGTPTTMDLSNSTLKGSALNMKLNVYDRHVDSINGVGEKLIAPYVAQVQAGGKTEEEMQAMVVAIQEQLEPLQKELVDYTKKIITDNSDNVIPAVFIDNVMYDYEFDELKALLDPKFAYANHPMLYGVKAYLTQEEAKQAIVGKQFIDIEENDVNDKPHKLSEYVGKGNYVLIDFWASW